MGVIYFLQSAMLLKKRTLAGNNRKKRAVFSFHHQHGCFQIHIYIFVYIRIFIHRGTEICTYMYTFINKYICYNHQTCVCRSRLAQVKLMLSLDLDPRKPHEWFFFGWVEWRHGGATKPWEVHPKQTRFIGECRWELDGLEKVQDLRDLTFSRWRWGICKDEDDISMNIIQRMSTMACHWQKKHPFKISVSLQQESQATARTFGWGDANGGLVCRCPQSFSGKALGTL